ncbi:hypothetical protein T440DRAFT_35933 [Plenodomus tracheiphilus IPT5]|uniref:Uncharacterized protein n=1 Tax=Plenodomus tracheiphilus IPT5 TaxID=1408161 RepID=A0A6A7BBM0_9PLEO|nr:hypothetical protein T440DRAFT_35933 [Plenodomus tracheiphilus IPT5]
MTSEAVKAKSTRTDSRCPHRIVMGIVKMPWQQRAAAAARRPWAGQPAHPRGPTRAERCLHRQHHLTARREAAGGCTLRPDSARGPASACESRSHNCAQRRRDFTAAMAAHWLRAAGRRNLGLVCRQYVMSTRCPHRHCALASPHKARTPVIT